MPDKANQALKMCYCIAYDIIKFVDFGHHYIKYLLLLT